LLIAFTRIESPGDYTEIGSLPEEQRVPLGRSSLKWVPTSEVRGEGVFLQFCEKAIEAWIKKTNDRDKEFYEAHRRWRTSRGHPHPDADYPTMRYVLLHSLAHALIRQFSLECGYTTASIRETHLFPATGRRPRTDGGRPPLHCRPDSEGTLGGLVSLGEPKSLGRHLDQALEAMRLCTSDPSAPSTTPTATV